MINEIKFLLHKKVDGQWVPVTQEDFSPSIEWSDIDGKPLTFPPLTHTHTLSSGAIDVTITATDLNTLDDGADSNLHYHSSDRSRANHTGTQLSNTISDFASAVASAAPNAVTSATTSDGTANLSISTATVSGMLTAGHIHGNLAGTLYTHVRTGEAMSKGDPFYISGYHVGSSQPIAMRADANDAAKMPAIGVMDADYAANTSGANGIISGTLSSIDTDGYVVNSPIFVANGGGYSNDTGRIPQQIGITERANANTGSVVITNVTAHPYFSDVTIATDGALQISNGSGAAYLRAGLTTDVRDFDLPDESGTVLLSEQLTSGTFSANINSLQVQSSATFEASSVTTFDTGAEVNFLGLNNYENAATFTYGATASAAHRTALGLSAFPVLLGSVRAAAYNYNGSNQTINRYGLQPSAFLSSTISPTSNFTKGTYGEVIATGQTYNIGHGSFTNHTAPETYVWLLRLTSGSANAKMRARSYNLFYNSGTLSLWYADIAAFGTNLITKTITDGDIICCAWSGNANTTRAALFHGGTVQSASKQSGVYAANATSFGTLQVGAGNGGASGGIEFIGAFSFAGLMSEDELKNLCVIIYNQNI